MALALQNSLAGVNAPGYSLPAAISASLKQLVIEKLPSDAAFDLAVRDGKTGFTFFNIEGHQYDYDPNAQSLSITGGNLLVSQEFANALGRPSEARASVGKISIGAAMQPIEIDQVVNGELRSMIMPALRQPAVGTQPGPGCHRWKPARNGTIWPCWNSSWPGGRNRFLQQRDRERRLVCITEQRSPRGSTEHVSHE